MVDFSKRAILDVPAYSSDRFPRSAAIVMTTVFLATIMLGMFVPIYMDEVGWKILQARYFLDGYTNITLLPQCGAPFAIPVPWFIVPVRAADAWLYENLLPPLKLRLISMATFVGWIGLLLAMLPKSLAFRASPMTLAGVTAAFLGLGVLPFMLVINRPEKFILICITLLLLTPLLLPGRRPLAQQVSFAAALLIIMVGLIAEHPKTLLFMPLVLVSGFFLVQRWWLRLLTAGAIGYVAVAGYIYWIARNKCPGDLALEAGSQAQLIPPSALLTDPVGTIGQFLWNILRSVHYFRAVVIRNSYGPENWLPQSDIPSWILLSLWALMVLVFAGIILIIIVSLLVTSIRFFRSSGSITGEHAKRFALVLSCLVAVSALTVIQSIKHFYEAALMLPILGLIALLCIPPNIDKKFNRLGVLFGLFLIGVSLVSQTTLWWAFVPEMKNSILAGGYLEGQHMSYSPFNYDSKGNEAIEAARKCDIEPSGNLQHVVVDELTYPLFAQSFQPFHVFFIAQVGGIDIWGPQESAKITRFLTERRSDGIIASCLWLPEEMRNMSMKTGPFCCMPSF